MFTENQVRQFYVATSTGSDVIAPQQVDSSHAATDLSAKSAGACQFIINATGDEAYLEYKGPSDDGVQRSDLIKKCNVMDVRLTDAADLVHTNKKAVITLDSSLVSSSNLTITGDYILNVEIHNYLALDYNSTKIKFGAVRGVAGSSASDFYKKMALSLAKNFSREGAPLLKISITKTNATGAAANNVLVTGKESSISAISGTAVGIVIEEAVQPWRLGAAKQEFVDFTVAPGTVYDSTNHIDVVWGKVQFYGSSTYTDGTSSAVTIAAAGTQPNSKGVADMEYFFHKERGDRYGFAGFPYNIDTTYLVDPSDASGYSFIDIHFFFEGNSHNVGKSEKTLTIVGTKTNLKKLFGSPASSSGGTTTPATGLYAFLEGTGVTIVTSASW